MRQNLLAASVFVVLISLFAWSATGWRLPGTAKPKTAGEWCGPHDVALAECEQCNPRIARGGTFTMREREPKEGECPNTLVRVTLGPGVAEQVNLQMQTAELRSIAETIRANAEVQYPPSKVARVAPRLTGIIREVRVSLGQEVEAGETLAVIEANGLGEAKSDYLQAIAVLNLRQKTHEQEKALFEKKLTTGRELLQAETQLEEARLALQRAAQKLSVLGLTAENVKDVAVTKQTSALLEIQAPFKGTIVAATAVPGESTGPEKPIFSVAVLDRMWLAIDVHEADLARIEKEQRVLFTIESAPGQKFVGKTVAIGAEVDDRTRTIKVFANVKNLGGFLRANMFGRAEITVKPVEPKLILPKEAVQSDGDCFIVFVSPSPNAFQARKVELGTAYESGYEAIGGITAGEKFVTTGSFLLKTEVLKGQLGAG